MDISPRSHHEGIAGEGREVGAASENVLDPGRNKNYDNRLQAITLKIQERFQHLYSLLKTTF
jgi:hypothetical protein